MKQSHEKLIGEKIELSLEEKQKLYKILSMSNAIDKKIMTKLIE